MSRRRGEFEHRTSIFEGAFRAWSHLGGLTPDELESKSVAELDPLTNPILNDDRAPSNSAKLFNPDGSVRRDYPYEPLPRSGLSHPYVQAILSPWLGPDADNEAIQLGLTTLRTWWQHRRKGESGSAIAALGTEKMKGVVEGYTRHFFTLAHCLIVNDKEQAPRTLHNRLKEEEKLRSKKMKKRTRDDGSVTGIASSFAATVASDLTDTSLTPLERLHAAQRRQLAENGAVATVPDTEFPVINIKGKCIPGKIDLTGVVDQVNRQANQLAHRGITAATPSHVSSGGLDFHSTQYGDPNTTPVVFVSGNGDIQIAMKADGITCAHCVKIVETVLKGCNGNKSPINGLLDAAADRDLCSVLIKIDKASNAKRIAFEAARNLAMVGYTAKAKEMSIVGKDADEKATMDLGALSTAFEVVAATDSQDVFDWTIPCTCPDNGVLREDCARHSQMNTRIFEAFDARETQVKDYMAGCAMKYGMPCTCGPSCRCKNCPLHGSASTSASTQEGAVQPLPVNEQDHSEDHESMDMFSNDSQPIQVDQDMEFFGMEPPTGIPGGHPPPPQHNNAALPIPVVHLPQHNNHHQHQSHASSFEMPRAQRNPSIMSYGNGLRHMSLTSETTFGRAMSGLSALSIDWENLDDFDLEVDHSAHITHNSPTRMMDMGGRRSSLRRSLLSAGAAGQQDEPHVSFKVES